MNSKHNVFIIFYSTDAPLNFKDIDKEVNTQNNEEYHLFFFHNQNIHFDKSNILKAKFFKLFESVDPTMHYDLSANTVTMKKTIKDFNFEKFDKEVDIEYNIYLKNINYRIDCIFQTFMIFNNLYEDRSSLYILPFKLHRNFCKILKKNKILFDYINKKQEIIKKYNVLDVVKSFSKTDTEEKIKTELCSKNIKKIISIK